MRNWGDRIKCTRPELDWDHHLGRYALRQRLLNWPREYFIPDIVCGRKTYWFTWKQDSGFGWEIYVEHKGSLVLHDPGPKIVCAKLVVDGGLMTRSYYESGKLRQGTEFPKVLFSRFKDHEWEYLLDFPAEKTIRLEIRDSEQPYGYGDWDPFGVQFWKWESWGIAFENGTGD